MKTKMNFIAVAILTLFVLTGIAAHADGSNRKALSRENNVEESVSLEAWMTNGEIWDVKSSEFNAEVEEALTIESWMTESFNFEVSNSVDAPVQLENWMINENIWNSIESEKVMALEAWMTQESKWNVIR